MEIKNDTYVLKTQECRRCGIHLDISREDLSLSSSNTVVYKCPCCHSTMGITYTTFKDTPNIGTLREIQEEVQEKKEENAGLIGCVCFIFIGILLLCLMCSV